MEAHCRRLDDRRRPLAIGAGSTFGRVRSLMGTEAASLALYDDPELVHDIIETNCRHNRQHILPLIERLRPEIVVCWEDIGYKTSMLIGPEAFRRFCAPLYREVADCARACGVSVLAVDSDGCAMQLVPLLVECGFNALYPFEVKGGNDLAYVVEDDLTNLLIPGSQGSSDIGSICKPEVVQAAQGMFGMASKPGTEKLVAVCDVYWGYAPVTGTFEKYPSAKMYKDWRV